MKSYMRSKTILTGLAVLLPSVAVVLTQTWQLLSPDDVAAIRTWFGPEMTSAIGIAMIVLRIVTESPVKWGGDA